MNGPWESFEASYDLLNLDWFDDAYFAEYGPPLVKRAVHFVQANRFDFIEQNNDCIDDD